jgi:hypothetical protein
MTALSRPTIGAISIVWSVLISVGLGACVAQQGSQEIQTSKKVRIVQSVEQTSDGLPERREVEFDKAKRNSTKLGRDAYKNKDFKSAFQILLPLAEAGNSIAQYYVSRMKRHGDGVQQDNEEAFLWLLKSAEQDFWQSHFLLGAAYLQGLGVKADVVKAYKWISIAERWYMDSARMYVHSDASALKKAIILEMTRSQIAMGEKLAKAYFQTHD